MKQEIKDKWLKALRSGEYVQGQMALNDQSGFCCLGILCDLAAKEGVGAWKEYNSMNIFTTSKDSSTAILPKPVISWAGLDHPNPIVPFEGGVLPLSRVNDSGTSFDEIADIIEENL